MKTKPNPMRKHCLAFFPILFFFGSCLNPGSSELEEAKKAIAESNAIYFKSFEKNDSSIFFQRYADDACILVPDAPAMCGPQAALDFFKFAYDNVGLRNGKFITTKVYGLGDGFVTEEGEWQSVDASN